MAGDSSKNFLGPSDAIRASSSVIDVPIRRPNVDQHDSSTFYAGDNPFVGSPDQMDSYDFPQPPSTSRSIIHPGIEPGTRRARPSLGNRSISSPLYARRRGNASVPTTAQRITSGIFGSFNTRNAPPEHQWSVFGQLMENEVQFRNPNSRMSNLVNADEDITPRANVPDPFAGSETQSPIAEDYTNHFQADAQSRDFSTDNDDDDDDIYDSDSETISTSPSSEEQPQSKDKWFSSLSPNNIPLLYRNIFKCALAYFIGSLFTFSPYLSGFISDITSYGPGERKPAPSGHMVATIAVYFNPAKTMGAMLEADLYCLCGLLYSSFVCLSTMSMFWWLEMKPGWEWLGDVLVIVWIGVSMSFVAWMKVYMASPPFNTACSMIAIILFVVLVKEGGLQTLLQVSFIVICGSITSNLVCYLVWPQTATANLQTNMTKTLDSFSTLLTMLTNTFLLEEGHRLSQEKLQRAVEAHQGSFTNLKKNLKEARSEWLGGRVGQVRDAPAGNISTGNGTSARLGGVRRRKEAYEDAVDSMTRLAQHLNGLRSGTRLQYELTKAGVVSGRGKRWSKVSNTKNKATPGDEEDEEEDAMLRSAAEMFGDLMDDLGPPLKALSTTCTSSLKRLRESFVLSQAQPRSVKKKDEIQPHEFEELVDGIEKALVRFESTSNHAVLRLYRKTEASVAGSRASVYSIMSTEDREKENSMLIGGDNEHVFLVYFFIFTLQEFATELVSLVDAMARIYNQEQARVHRPPWWKRMFRGLRQRLSSLGRSSTSSTEDRRRKKRPGLKRTLSSYMVRDNLERHTQPSFPKVRPHAPNTIQTPPRSKLTFIGRVKQSLWSIGERLGERDMKYAIKAGMATAILAAPAFFDATRPIFVDYYFDWALISFFVVISPTIGATNYLSLQRVLGTVSGATVAAIAYTLFPDDAIVLSIFGFLFSLPCFYFLVGKPQYASASRFVLLTYNLTCLYCYNLRQKDLSVIHVAWHRALAVTGGVVWAAFVARFWWPAEARRELSKALGEFCLNMGWLYTRLVASNSFAPEYRDEATEDDSVPLITEGGSLLSSPAHTRLNNSIQEFMAMELHLQIKLIELQGLLAQTQHEPRLKGPFPVQLYRGVLTSLQTILDKLHSMRCVTTREEWYTSVRQDFIIPVNKERKEMVGNIILSFSTLASAFRLKAPLPPYLPPAEKSRQRLVDAIRKLDVVRNRDVKGSRQLLFFAYALTMKGVTDELELLGRTLQNAFGVIGQTPEEFEALFMDPTESQRRIDHAA